MSATHSEGGKTPVQDVIVNLDRFMFAEAEARRETSSAGTDGPASMPSSASMSSRFSSGGNGTPRPASKATSKGTCTGRRLVTTPDRASVSAYPYHLATGLLLCEEVERVDDDSHNGQAKRYRSFCGLECRHCGRYRSFPENLDEVEDDLKDFRHHFRKKCRRVPAEWRAYLRWMEKRDLDEGSMGTAAALVGRWMDTYEDGRNEALRREERKRRRERQRRTQSVLADVQSL